MPAIEGEVIDPIKPCPQCGAALMSDGTCTACVYVDEDMNADFMAELEELWLNLKKTNDDEDEEELSSED